MATATRETSASAAPPGPGGAPLLGNILQMRREGPLAFHTRLWQQYGDVFLYHAGWIPVYTFIHPDDVEVVLRSREDMFDKDSIIEQRARRVIPQSLIMSNHRDWQPLRPLMETPFSRQEVPTFLWTATQAVDMLDERWQRTVRANQTVEMVDEMQLVTFSAVCRLIFGEDLSMEGSSGRSAIELLMGHVQDSILALVDVPPWIPTPRNRRFQHATRTLRVLLDRQIARRRQDPQSPHDLIGHLLLARDANGRGLTDSEIRDNALAFFIAGQEMTGLTLAWAWYLLGRNPDAEERLHAELDAVLCGRTPDIEDFPKLDYTRRVIEETMRLYPTAWILARTVLGDVTIGTYPVPKDATVALIPYLTHRHPEFWPAPDAFDPDRLRPERVRGLPRYAFFPFGGGERKCIGNKYALQLLLVTLAHLAQRYRPRLTPADHLVDPIAISAIRPRYGLPMTLQER